ncbi:hypothetical protein BDM02DRAFT_3113428 [Thelephora ganbajun]|uniref:Uncharacterized protein n=1 Tax=Thelephora ganbajun TaxID=370292 RepID=A0ACB6ZIK0_THEGA|nr:hypothetical protein BDM02DRAFT_3113428 [Thelephora ganbajun]
MYIFPPVVAFDVYSRTKLAETAIRDDQLHDQALRGHRRDGSSGRAKNSDKTWPNRVRNPRHELNLVSR